MDVIAQLFFKWRTESISHHKQLSSSMIQQLDHNWKVWHYMCPINRAASGCLTVLPWSPHIWNQPLKTFHCLTVLYRKAHIKPIWESKNLEMTCHALQNPKHWAIGSHPKKIYTGTLVLLWTNSVLWRRRDFGSSYIWIINKFKQAVPEEGGRRLWTIKDN